LTTYLHLTSNVSNFQALDLGVNFSDHVPICLSVIITNTGNRPTSKASDASPNHNNLLWQSIYCSNVVCIKFLLTYLLTYLVWFGKQGSRWVVVFIKPLTVKHFASLHIVFKLAYCVCSIILLICTLFLWSNDCYCYICRTMLVGMLFSNSYNL